MNRPSDSWSSERQNTPEEREFQMPAWFAALLGVAMVGTVGYVVKTTPRRSGPDSGSYRETSPRQVTPDPITPDPITPDPITTTAAFSAQQQETLTGYELIALRYEGTHRQRLDETWVVEYGSEVNGAIVFLKMNGDQIVSRTSYNHVLNRLMELSTEVKMNKDGASTVSVITNLFPQIQPSQYLKLLEQWNHTRPPLSSDND